MSQYKIKPLSLLIASALTFIPQAQAIVIDVGNGEVVNNKEVYYGDTLNIGAEGVSNDAIQHSGRIIITAGGIANNTVTKEGEVTVSGGTNNGNQLSGSAHENITNNGVSDGSVLTDSARQTITSGGTSRNAVLNGSSTVLTVMNGSSAVNTLVMDGTQRVNNGGQATGTIVNGGQLQVYDKGTVTDTTLNGGQSYLFGGARAEGYTKINNDASMVIYTNALAEDVTLNGGRLVVAALSDSSTGKPSAQVDKLTMNGGLVQFGSSYHYGYAQLNIGELNGIGSIWFETSLADKAGNFVTIGQGSGKFGVMVQDSGKEIADHTNLTLNLINDQGGDIDFYLKSARDGSSRAVDGGTYMYVLKQETGKDGMDGNVWYLGALTDDENSGGSGDGNLVTTPSTDAVLSLANAGLNIMRGEMDGLRAARQSENRDRQHGEGSVWGHYLGKKSAAETSVGAAYKLYQNGMELGGDVVTDLGNSQLVTGGFVSLTGNNVKHARGGTSSVDSYGLGAYATWYDNSGMYLDGTLKANRLESQLSARMTNGDMTSGKWHQYGLSAALEAGYTFTPMDNLTVEPFARMTGTTINDANVKLNNGMTAKTGKARSLTAEAGSRVATDFSLGNTALRPYLSISVEQELAHSNEAIINDVNRFKNHQNGTSGKYGAGITVSPAKDVTLYGELNYRQGSYVEEPVQGMAGIRISF